MCVRGLKLANYSHDSLKGESGLCREIVNLNVYENQKITTKSQVGQLETSDWERTGSLLKGQLFLSSSWLLSFPEVLEL